MTLYATALTPLVYLGNFFYPFITIKAFYFRGLVALALTLFLFLVATRALSINTSLLKKKLVWLPGIFLVASYVSSFFGLDFLQSFWSEYSRSEGLLTLTHLVVYFYLLVLSFGERQWTSFLKIISVISIIVSLSAIFEFFGWVAFGPEVGRAGGTINNASFLAAYLLITAPLTLYIGLLARDQGKAYWYYGLVGGSAISFITIFVTATRGAVLGILGALFVMLLLGTKFFGSNTWRKYAGIGLIILVLLGAGGVVFRDTLKGSSIEVLHRLGRISLDDTTTRSRLFIWKESLPEVTERPLLGYGSETFEYIYNEHYNPAIVPEEWFDRSHNIYIDKLLEGGLVGFLLYMSLLGIFISYVWQRRHTNKREFFIFGFLIVAYMIQNLFVFDSITTLILFYVLLAWAVFGLFGEDEKDGWILPEGVLYSASLFLLALVSLVSLYLFEYKPFVGNRLLYEGYTYQVVDTERSLTAWDEGREEAPFYGQEFGYQVYDSYFNKLGEGVSLPDQIEAYEYALRVLAEEIEKSPRNARLYVYRAHILESRPEGVALDEDLFFETIERAMELSPLRKQPHYILANYYLSKTKNVPYLPSEKENFEKGVEAIASYAEKNPNFAEPRLVLANLLLSNNEKERAEMYIQEAQKVYRPNPSDAERFINYYIRTEEFEKAEPFFEYLVRVNANDMNLLFDLAHIYAYNGKNDEAREALMEIEAVDPSVFERDPDFVRNLLGN